MIATPQEEIPVSLRNGTHGEWLKETERLKLYHLVSDYKKDKY